MAKRWKRRKRNRNRQKDKKVLYDGSGRPLKKPQKSQDFTKEWEDAENEKVNWGGKWVPLSVTQPRWKWSHDGKDLLIWPVDPRNGRPHHIEVTGSGFWKLNQGRVYVDKDGSIEILVWADRGWKEGQDVAVEDVEKWLNAKEMKSDIVTYEHEPMNWMTLRDLGRDPTTDEILNYYYQVPQDTGKKPVIDLSENDANEYDADELEGFHIVEEGDDNYDDIDGWYPPKAKSKEERVRQLMDKPIHSLTVHEWEELGDLVDDDWDPLMQEWEDRNWDMGEQELSGAKTYNHNHAIDEPCTVHCPAYVGEQY